MKQLIYFLTITNCLKYNIYVAQNIVNTHVEFIELNKKKKHKKWIFFVSAFNISFPRFLIVCLILERLLWSYDWAKWLLWELERFVGQFSCTFIVTIKWCKKHTFWPLSLCTNYTIYVVIFQENVALSIFRS